MKVSGKMVLKALVDRGWKLVARHGSHCQLQLYDKKVTVPMYPEYREGTISYISAELGMEKAEFLQMLE